MEFSPHRLRGHRHGVGRTLGDLASRVGRGVEALKAYETGRSQPPAGVLRALAIELGVDMDDLFTRHDDPVLDYVSAVAEHCPPLTHEQVQGAVVVLRTMRQARAARQVPA